MSIDMGRLMQALDAQRADRGASWRTVASEVGVSSGLFSRMGVGQRGPDLESYVKCCRWLGVPLDTFSSAEQGGHEASGLGVGLAMLLTKHGVPKADGDVVLSMVRVYLRSRGVTQDAAWAITST